MKKTLFLEDIGLPEIKVLAINSHAKGYKLCWNINKELKLNFQKSEYKEITTQQKFLQYKHYNNDEVEYNIIANRSQTGYFIPDQKGVNYFLIINKKKTEYQKKEIIEKLRGNKEILDVSEIEIKKSTYIERFINDTKN